MNQWEVDLAKLFKERENPAPDGITKAIVISPLPNLRLSIGEDIILEGELLVVSTNIHRLNPKVGSAVIVMPTSNGQTYYVLDGVGAVVSGN